MREHEQIFGQAPSFSVPEIPFDSFDESVYMHVEVPSLIHSNRVAFSQWDERERQVGLARHPGMIDQDRDHG